MEAVIKLQLQNCMWKQFYICYDCISLHYRLSGGSLEGELGTTCYSRFEGTSREEGGQGKKKNWSKGMSVSIPNLAHPAQQEDQESLRPSIGGSLIGVAQGCRRSEQKNGTTFTSFVSGRTAASAERLQYHTQDSQTMCSQSIHNSSCAASPVAPPGCALSELCLFFSFFFFLWGNSLQQWINIPLHSSFFLRRC